MFVSRSISACVSSFVASIAVLAAGGNAVQTAVVAVSVASDLFCELEQAILAGKHRQHASANLSVAQRGAPFLLILVSMLNTSLTPLLAYGAGTFLVLLMVCVRPLRQWTGKPKLRTLYRSARGDWAASISSSLIQLDSIVVTLTTGPIGIGLYAAATKVASPVNIVTSAILTIAIPTVAKSFPSDRDRLLKRAFVFVTVFGIALAALSPVIANFAIFLLGAEYAKAKSLICGVIIGASLLGVGVPLRARLFVSNKGSIVASSVTGGATVGLATFACAGLLGGPSSLWIGPIAIHGATLVLLWMGSRTAQD
jgi:O-antigen/teichoic acid export membrane protein